MATKYEMSKTYQYRKVMKPLLERRRRARINNCLDDLKEIMGECMQSENGDSNVKLEKADILELTVNHLQKLKVQRLQHTPQTAAKKSFRSGYIHAANEVSRCLATLPNVNIALGTRLMTHLGLRLNQLETADDVEQQQQQQQQTAINTPLNINCNNLSINLKTQQQQPSMYSPTSSGYDSDTDSSNSATTSTSTSTSYTSQGLLQVATQVWRPW